MPVDGLWPLLCVPAIAIGALVAGAMSRAGAVAGGLVGVAVTSGAGWSGLLMLGTLLLAGTLCSRRGRRRRGALQASCNGVVAAAAALAAGWGAPWGRAALAGALATALSDTVAGELGRRSFGSVRALLFGRALEPGVDGGMSWQGTGLGLVAALPIPLLGWPQDLRTALLIAAAAFAGNILDSVTGLALQPRLGRRGNDWTNLIATFGGAALAVAWTS